MEGTGFAPPGEEMALGRPQYLQGVHQEDAARIFTVVHGGRTRDNGHKLKQQRPLNWI